MTAKEWLNANAGGMTREESISACMKATGCCRDNVVRSLKLSKPIKSIQSKALGKSLADFRLVHDVRLKIRAGIKKYLKGDSLFTDQEFREACGVCSQEWSRYARDGEFDDNNDRIKQVLYWATPSTLREMRTICGLPVD